MEFLRAESLEHATESLANFGDRARVMAGGTCVMPSLAAGDFQPEALLVLEGLNELRGSQETERGLELGALTRMDELAGSNELAGARQLLADAAAQVGGWQTRCVATLGGNLCQSTPVGDLLCVLLACDASVELRSQERGPRRVGLDSFFDARGSALQADELLTQVVLPPSPIGARSWYAKVGRRSAMEVAIVAVSCWADISAGGELREVRFAASGLSACPRRFPDVERKLLGNPGAIEVASAVETLLEASEARDDVWASASYRRSVAGRLLREAVTAISSEENRP